MSFPKVALKRLCMEPPQYGVNVPASEYRNEGIRLVRTSDITESGVLRQDSQVFVDPVYGHGHELQEGDVLLSRSGTLGRALAWSEGDVSGTFAGYLVRFRPIPERVDSRYLWYATQSQPFQGEIEVEATQATIANLNARRYSELKVPNPPLAEQHRIADFLSHQVAVLRDAGQKCHGLVGLLGERDESVLANALARIDGTDMRIRRIGRTIGGTGFPHAYQGSPEGDLPFVKVSDMRRDGPGVFVEGAENWISRDAARELGARVVPEGAVIFPKVGAALLKNPRRLTARPCVVDNNVMAIVPEGISGRYLRYALLRVDFGQLANPGPVPSLNAEQVLDLKICVPSRREQERVSDRLDEQIGRHSGLRGLVLRRIELLAERRKTLITAAVTGQLDPSTYRGQAPAAA